MFYAGGGTYEFTGVLFFPMFVCSMQRGGVDITKKLNSIVWCISSGVCVCVCQGRAWPALWWGMQGPSEDRYTTHSLNPWLWERVLYIKAGPKNHESNYCCCFAALQKNVEK